MAAEPTEGKGASGVPRTTLWSLVKPLYAVPNPYEQLKAFTRGQQVTQQSMMEFVDGIEGLPAHAKEDLKKLTPSNYIGNAVQQAKSCIGHLSLPSVSGKDTRGGPYCSEPLPKANTDEGNDRTQPSGQVVWLQPAGLCRQHKVIHDLGNKKGLISLLLQEMKDILTNSLGIAQSAWLVQKSKGKTTQARSGCMYQGEVQKSSVSEGKSKSRSTKVMLREHVGTKEQRKKACLSSQSLF
eukprot:1154237-Pelagomonas_calceolata.AAC.2